MCDIKEKKERFICRKKEKAFCIQRAGVMLAAGILCFSLAACGSVKAETKEIRLPESLILFSGSTAEETEKSYKELGKAYCTDAYVDGGGLVMVMTDQQVKNMLDYNNDWVEELTEKFEASGNGYEITGDSHYQSVDFSYDENMAANTQIETIYGIVAMYGMNYILTEDADWSVDVSIVNCHTGRTVAEGTLPEETLNFDNDDWRASYEDE